MSGALLAVIVVLAGLVWTTVWFGVSRRRRAETEFGVQALADLKWRDCTGLVLEALAREGYAAVGDDGSGNAQGEILLQHGAGKTLLGFKHGTAYCLGETSVREFANTLDMRGARSGILLTLGSVEGDATRSLAESSRIQLFDGTALWHKLQPLVPAELSVKVAAQARGQISKGLWVGSVSSLLAGLLTFVVSQVGAFPGPAQAAGDTRPPASVRAPSAPAVETARRDDAVLARLNATAQAMAEVAKMTPEQLAQRRASAAKQVSQIAQVDTAAWSAQRTLLLNLNQTDGKDKVLIEEACRILTQHEEMRFTRIQLNPPADLDLAVRWRLCE